MTAGCAVASQAGAWGLGRLDPWRIGKIVAAALVLLHFEHGRATRQRLVANPLR
jgi:hypothetical protein